MLTFMDRLAAADPARTVPPYEQATAAKLLEHATDPAAPYQSTEAAPPARRRGRRGALLLGAAAAATAAALTLGPAVIGGGTGPGGATPAAAALLQRAADITVSDSPARAEQYYRITTRAAGLSAEGAQRDGRTVGIGWRTSTESIQYVAVDGRRPSYWVDRSLSDPVRLYGPSDTPPPPREDRASRARTTNLSPVDIPASWQVPTPGWLAGLPREPGALRERMYADAAGHGPSTDTEVLVLASDVLRSGLVPADLRAALYRVLRTVPGVTVTSEQVTLDGRSGVGIGRTEDRNGLRQEIVVETASGQVIGERTLVARALDGMPLPVGSVFSESSLSRQVVDAVPADVIGAARHDTCEVTSDGAVQCRLGPEGRS